MSLAVPARRRVEMSAPKGGQLVCGEALKAVVACTKSALTLRPLPFPFLPVCVASSCASPEVQARALFFAQRRSAALQGASWWSKKVFEGVPAELRQLLDALLRGADHGSGHTGQRHGCRRDRVVAYGQRQCVHRVRPVLVRLQPESAVKALRVKNASSKRLPLLVGSPPFWGRSSPRQKS